MNREDELEVMKNRLRKAYSMTSKEQKKWHRQIEELEIAVARLGQAKVGEAAGGEAVFDSDADAKSDANISDNTNESSNTYNNCTITVTATATTTSSSLEKKMEQRYLEVNQQLSMELNKLCSHTDFNAYFTRNPVGRSIVNEACAGIERAFELKSMDILELKLELYEDAFRQLGQNCIYTKSGEFQEVTKEEEEQIKLDFVKIGWK